MNTKLSKKFLDKIILNRLTGCWEWQGRINKDGYGLIGHNYKDCRAHRLVYEILLGIPKEAECLDHLCNNKKCVNPSHMKPTTMKENILRSNNAAGTNFRKTKCIRGHLFMGRNLRISKKTGYRICRTCHNLRQKTYMRNIE